jgi:hypothetical protein
MTPMVGASRDLLVHSTLPADLPALRTVLPSVGTLVIGRAVLRRVESLVGEIA